MKRKIIIRDILKYLNKDDIAIFFGIELCSDAYKYDRPGNLYVENESVSLSFGLGLAISTKKRVFVFCRDIKLLADYSAIFQIGVSGCTNIFVMVMGDGTHTEADGQPNICGELKNVMGLLFNSGVLVNNYNQNIEKEIFDSAMKMYLPTIRGPLVAIMNADTDKSVVSLDAGQKDMVKRFVSFVKNSEE